ncbi:element excision factor XisH family protein [Lyngbya sp. PCC 8106]|uniref:element excision factor XisH family protein n=1 Tax=Lyngbya sp. (strain PCC 8106) TaxID=313612 RepID=UPI0000EAB5D7|nr:element excision factor XisH family protein [Lyngbya sp. PCC 8106]EAW35996.1 fdxN element excision controlling factor XisH [Lyngbya sp. PCC 8106]
MPRLDLYHNVVRAALVKDGWTITHDPFTIVFEDLTVYADLGAEKMIAAQKSGEKIAIEIKVFRSPSPVTELERAIGQYYLYLTFINQQEPDRNLYLAVPKRTYDNFFQRPSIQMFLKERQIPFFVFNPEREEIVKWIVK